MIGGEQQDQPSGGSQISLEQKLDLLESRFTRPTVPAKDNSDMKIQSTSSPAWGNQDNLMDKHSVAATPQPSSGRTSPHHNSNSEHSFQFSRQQHSQSPHNSNPLPPSAVRSRRRLSLQSTSFQSVAQAAARHMRKVAAASPVQGISTSTNNPQQNQLDGSRLSSSSNSNATMITSNQRQTATIQHNAEQRVVAESPPVIVSPHNNSTPVRKPNKPNAVRHLMMAGNATTSSAAVPPRSSPRQNKAKTVENDTANESNIMTRSRSTEKSSPVKPTSSTVSWFALSSPKILIWFSIVLILSIF